ncbi:hypothetical protein SAMN05660642_04464 [Geodermatophilus siccatus]|uniref:Alpha/beta hydrolase family protein n=1 Tax=Geodermatophilus siccatus TaxID=1137991 RepID=A0A1H0A188_9ACTN|nr:hypothetical protein [Geodermatophilus siccatus]SDN27167.1 hypothetical protein SAMN05660642_04464 [Geodermatophilus siccatus]
MGDVLVEEVRAAVADLPEQVPDGFARESTAGTVYREVAPDVSDALVAESRKAPGSVHRDSWEGLVRVDDPGRLRDVTAPTLLLRGDADALFDRGQQDRLLAALPDARLRVYEDTGTAPLGAPGGRRSRPGRRPPAQPTSPPGTVVTGVSRPPRRSPGPGSSR